MRGWFVAVGAIGLALAFDAGAQTPAQKPAAPKAWAKVPRTAADQKPQPYPLTDFYAPPPTPTGIGRTMRPMAYRFAPCVDGKVAALAGLPREEALKRVRAMNLMEVRVLAYETPVSYERVPERLTLIVSALGKVSRAFCR